MYSSLTAADLQRRLDYRPAKPSMARPMRTITTPAGQLTILHTIDADLVRRIARRPTRGMRADILLAAMSGATRF